MTTAPSTETTAKKDIQKLQRAIIDGLEDVKAQDIQVFDTEHLSALFERVIIASGTSNRQTKALAASVRDAVREAGFGKPRIEGEENGEWIIVDCGAAVAHIMQPAIRQYYHLEEIWGDTPVRLKLGAPKPAGAKEADKPEPKLRVKAAVKKVPMQSPRSTKPVAGKTAVRKTRVAKPEVVYAPERPVLSPAKKAATTRPGTAAATAAAKTAVPKPVAKTPARSAPVKTAAVKTTVAKTAGVKTVAAKPAVVKTAPAKTALKTAPKTAVKTALKTIVVRNKPAPARKAAAQKAAEKPPSRTSSRTSSKAAAKPATKTVSRKA